MEEGERHADRMRLHWYSAQEAASVLGVEEAEVSRLLEQRALTAIRATDGWRILLPGQVREHRPEEAKALAPGGQETSEALVTLVRDLQRQNLALAGHIGFLQSQLIQLRTDAVPQPVQDKGLIGENARREDASAVREDSGDHGKIGTGPELHPLESVHAPDVTLPAGESLEITADPLSVRDEKALEERATIAMAHVAEGQQTPTVDPSPKRRRWWPFRRDE
jgi:hypothetical protein